MRQLAITALGPLALLLAAFPAAAQPQTIAAQQIFQGSPPGVPRPPRDRREPQPTGTATIRGRVLALDTGRPLRRARILLSAQELGSDGRATSTGLDGRYEFKDLPAGRYTIRVSRSGYLNLDYGQRRPLEAGKPLQVADKQIVDRVNFSLPRASVIAGRIVDEFGEPVASVMVVALRPTYWQGRRRLVSAGFAAPTDDAGGFRITGLMPGSYVVQASLRETWTTTENGAEQVMGYAPTYFPGTGSTLDARRVAVGVGQEVGQTNFALVPGRAALVSGIAFDSQGAPLAGRLIALTEEVSGPGSVMMMMAGNATTAADGTFSFKNVPPGQYKLRMQGGGARGMLGLPPPGTPLTEAATLPITLDGADLTNVSLVASSGWSISGQLLTDNNTPPVAPRDRFRLYAAPVDSDASPGGPLPTPGPGAALGGPFGVGSTESGRLRDDWTFTVAGVFGAARLRASVPDGWAVTSILQDGRDIADRPVEMRSGEELTGVQVIVTRRITSVSGQLAPEDNVKNAPISDGTIIVFAEDSEKWGDNSRWVRAVRPDQQGRYEIKGLPPGQYLAIAVDYVEDGQWNDPEYLESIRRFGQRLTLGEGESPVLSLKLVTP